MAAPGTGLRPDGTVAYDAVLHLLDRQVVDRDGLLVCKVDDVELGEVEGRWVVAALLTGPDPLGRRVGGTPGRLMTSVWRRLRGRGSRPGRIDLAVVTGIGSHVQVGVGRDSLGVDGFEDWVRRHVVAKIPGAGHAPE
jgi:hypothetical protein